MGLKHFADLGVAIEVKGRGPHTTAVVRFLDVIVDKGPWIILEFETETGEIIRLPMTPDDFRFLGSAISGH